MLEEIERIIVETKEGEKIATIINDDKINESIIVADGYTVRIKPKASQPLGAKMKCKSAIKDAIKELKYSIEPNQGFMECRTGAISEEAIRMAIEALEKQMQNCGNCLRADHVPNYHMVYCRVHNSVTSDDNCCRYWTPLE